MFRFLDDLLTVIFAPNRFFADISAKSWNEEPLTFTMICSWILAIALTLVVLVNSYIPTGINLISGVAGKKLFIVLPVLLVMGVAFFLMTLLIIAGILTIALVSLALFCAAVLNFLFMLLGGSGNMMDVFKSTLYSNAVILAGLINIVLMVPVKFHLFPVGYWILGEKVIFLIALLYLFVLFAAAGAVTHKLSRWKAFLASTVPFVVLLLANMIFASKILPKLVGFLS